jgi:hypothetical protein
MELYLCEVLLSSLVCDVWVGTLDLLPLRETPPAIVLVFFFFFFLVFFLFFVISFIRYFLH